MDAIDENQIGGNENAGMELLDNTIRNLDETRKWTNFIAIVAFVIMGLMVVIGFTAGTYLSQMSGGQLGNAFPGFLIGVIYFIIALIYFFPIMYLYRFSVWTKRAVVDRNMHDMDIAFQNLKSHYKYMGVLMIIGLVVYGLIFIFALGSSLMGGFD